MTSDQVILFFLVVHIVSAGIWVSQFVAELALERFASVLKGKPSEAALALARGNVNALMGTVGGVGLLISGVILTAGFHYGVVGIGGVFTPVWLSIMEIIFVIAMGLVGMTITAPFRRLKPVLQQAVDANQPLSSELKSSMDRLILMSRIVNVIVLINIFVGIYGVNGVIH